MSKKPSKLQRVWRNISHIKYFRLQKLPTWLGTDLEGVISYETAILMGEHNANIDRLQHSLQQDYNRYSCAYKYLRAKQKTNRGD